MALTLFRPGDKITADRLNELIAEVKRIGNLKVSGDLEMQNTKNGIFIGLKPGIITIDEKYKQDNRANTATEWRRLSDLKRASVNSEWRILAIDDPEPEEEGEEAPEALYRIMFLMDDNLKTWDDKGNAEPGGWGGWFCTAAGTGLDKEEAYYEFEVPEPTEKNFAQIQSFFLLSDDDRNPTASRDGNFYTYFNMRDDGHVHRSVAKDGRIFFTDTDPGDEPDGFPIIGEMVGDPAKANTDTRLFRETVNWRPQINVPLEDIPGEVYNPRNTTLWAFPPLVRIPSSSIMAYDFGTVGRDEGWSAHYQPQFKLATYGLGWQVKYSAENVDVVQQDAYIECDYKLANDGEDISTAGLASVPFTLPVPAASTEQDLNIAYAPLMLPATYAAKDLMIVDIWGRDAANVLDTLDERLLVIEVKLIYMIVLVPP